MKRPRLGKLARIELGRLRAAGIDPSPEDVLWLNKLGNIAEHGAADSRLVLYMSKRVGSFEVYPLTLGAKLWLQTIAQDWFGGDDTMLTFATVYALAHSRQPEKFAFKNVRQAKAKIYLWVLKVNLTADEIYKLMEELPRPDEKTFDPIESLKNLLAQIRKHPRNLDLTAALQCVDEYEHEGTEGGLCPALAILMRHYGGTREQWLWKESDAFITEMIKDALKKEARDRKERKGTEDAVDVNDPALIAFRRLRNATRQIMAEHNG